MSETTPEALRKAIAEHRAGGYFATRDGHRECYCGHVMAPDESYEAHVAGALLPVVAQEVAAAEQRGREEVRAQVEALADEWEREAEGDMWDQRQYAAADLRAALAEPAPEDRP